MRKVIVSINVTVDGFMAGLNGELDWHFESWDDEMEESMYEQLYASDTIVLGRITYTAMAEYWPRQEAPPGSPKDSFAALMNGCNKLVFSRSVRGLYWNNARLAEKSIGEEITALKNRPGRNILVYGSNSIVHAMMRLKLIDEYMLWVHPVLLGAGRPLFLDTGRMPLELFGSRTFASGVNALYYRTRRQTIEEDATRESSLSFDGCPGLLG